MPFDKAYNGYNYVGLCDRTCVRCITLETIRGICIASSMQLSRFTATSRQAFSRFKMSEKRSDDKTFEICQKYKLIPSATECKLIQIHDAHIQKMENIKIKMTYQTIRLQLMSPPVDLLLLWIVVDIIENWKKSDRL